jgi:hypothetical protein
VTQAGYYKHFFSGVLVPIVPIMVPALLLAFVLDWQWYQ